MVVDDCSESILLFAITRFRYPSIESLFIVRNMLDSYFTKIVFPVVMNGKRDYTSNIVAMFTP